MPYPESIFDVTENSRNVIKNKGFDYKGKIFEKSMSSFLFREEKRAAILEEIEKIVYEMIEQVKDIKKTFDYRKQKKYRDFN